MLKNNNSPLVTLTLLLFWGISACQLISGSPTPDHCSANLNCSEEEHLYRVRRAFVPYKTGKKVQGVVSSQLDQLLLYSGYDKRVRPQVNTKYSNKHLQDSGFNFSKEIHSYTEKQLMKCYKKLQNGSMFCMFQHF